MKLFIFPLLFFFIFSPLTATGPSYIKSEIKPISVNEKGEILCRTRFVKNPMGAHDYMDIEYGLAVITRHSIHPLFVDTLSFYTDSLDAETYLSRCHLYDSIYTTVGFNKDIVSVLNRLSIADKYNFIEDKVSKFEKNNTIERNEFEKLRDIDLSKAAQYSLHDGKGYYKDNEYVHVMYDFGNVVILLNSIEEEEQVGAVFDYINPLFGGIDYEYSFITGVLFLEKH